MRLALLSKDLPYYSIDEDDLVQPALAFLGGDWDPHWYTYGPLFSYILAFIFKFWKLTTSIVIGWTNEDFFYHAFFEPTSFYLLARAFHAFIIIVITIISWLYARKNYDSQTASVAFILGLTPFLDIATNFTMRIDTLLGLFSLLSLFFAAQFGKDKIKLRPYIMSGIFGGLCIATKPLPGLLVLPALVLGHFLSVWQTTNSSAKENIVFAVTQPNLWILACSVILVHALANPYSVIRFSAFSHEQYDIFFSQPTQGGNISGYDFSRLVSLWGWPMVVALAAVLLTVWRWSDNASRVLLIYTVTFCGTFLFFKMRIYWYNAVFPTVFILLARSISRVSQTIPSYLSNWRGRYSCCTSYLMNLNCFKSITIALLIGIVVFSPCLKTWRQDWHLWASPIPLVEKRADRAAQLWIERNLPAHSPILLVGWETINLPRIVADTAESQYTWGGYFMYHRDKNLPWVKAFQNAYARFQQTDWPTYRLVNIREHYSDDHPDPKLNSLLREDLSGFARQNGFRFIVTASPKKYEGTWEKEREIKQLALFNQDLGYTGAEVKIFEVLP